MYPNPVAGWVGVMPKVTSVSLSAASFSPLRSMPWNASSGSIKWSAGMTTIVAPGSRASIVAAASATHGAVSRAAGSMMICSRGNVSSSSSIPSACGGLVTIQVRSTPARSRTRSAVALISDSPWARGRNCLGRVVRLAGQKRVPDPPAMIMACMCRVRWEGGLGLAQRLPSGLRGAGPIGLSDVRPFDMLYVQDSFGSRM